jgi:hypothetical protein
MEGEISNIGQGIYEESSTANYDVGTRMALGDGRVFHYCKNGTSALTRSQLIQTPVNRTEVDDISNASAGDDYVTLATTAGAYTKNQFATAGAYTKNQFANGYMVIHDVGYVHKIRAHDAISSGGTGQVYLYDPIVAATSTNDVTLHKHPCSDVIVTADQVGFTIGIPLIAVTASYYFWAQTYGPAGVQSVAITLDDETHTLINSASGVSVIPTTYASGVTGAQVVAHTMYDAANHRAAEYELVYLRCMA